MYKLKKELYNTPLHITKTKQTSKITNGSNFNNKIIESVFSNKITIF